MPKIVALGGGTGLPVVLRSLKQLSISDLSITAVVCVSDNGGSSGRLKRELAIPAVGDLRNSILALAGPDAPLVELCRHRFRSEGCLDEHSLGNLMLAALWQQHRTLTEAIRRLGALAGMTGTVLPVTEVSTTLCAELDDGSVRLGESEITTSGKKIRKLWLDPGAALPAPGVLEALSGADIIVLGPGSLFTSIIPVLLVEGVQEALSRSPAVKKFVCNLMSQPGETDGFMASDHLRVLENYLGPGAIDICLLNSSAIEPRIERAYLKIGSKPVLVDEKTISKMGTLAVSADLLCEGTNEARHSDRKLAELLTGLLRSAAPPGEIIHRESA